MNNLIIFLILTLSLLVHAEEQDKDVYIQSVERSSHYQLRFTFINNTDRIVAFNCVFYSKDDLVTGNDMAFITPPAEVLVLHTGSMVATSYNCKRIK